MISQEAVWSTLGECMAVVLLRGVMSQISSRCWCQGLRVVGIMFSVSYESCSFGESFFSVFGPAGLGESFSFCTVC